ncbi:MAG: phospho-N-acetylmuramoyl-pentapeptide-transferase [Bacteriovoracaceae bacterium]|nr:phospho-N-acetylmuramoyl-pentapeptide-transferase [Bacteriovoracaceae bacterium]
MLFHFLYPYVHQIAGLEILRYITFRAFVAIILGFIFSYYFGSRCIIWLKQKQFGQVIRDVGPESHKKKGGTPTMGGLFIWLGGLVAISVCGNFFGAPFWAVLAISLGHAALGWMDDWKKIKKQSSDGISAREKLFWQFFLSASVCYFLFYADHMDGLIYIPFMKSPIMDLGWAYPLWASFVIVGTSNAVNLTDGLDGLAIGPIITSFVTLAILCYVGGHVEFSHYLFIPYVKNLSELSVICAAFIGAGLGFLWFNAYPAQVFMGDLGSLSLGSMIGAMAVISKNEFLLLIFGGIFVVEALSVILQVASFKTRRKRIFKMAPIHHHFELEGWEEPKVIVRFWIVGLLTAIISLSTLKIR